jgi:hypothetical protein
LVLTISREDLVQETDKIVDGIETFIGQKRTAATSIHFLKQECPRKIDTNIKKTISERHSEFDTEIISDRFRIAS